MELRSLEDRLFDEFSEWQLQVLKGIISIENLANCFKSAVTSKDSASGPSFRVPRPGAKWEETGSELTNEGHFRKKAQMFVQE